MNKTKRKTNKIQTNNSVYYLPIVAKLSILHLILDVCASRDYASSFKKGNIATSQSTLVVVRVHMFLDMSHKTKN